jgi:acylphosphatase
MNIIRHVIVKGRVQGVGYRMWTEQEAIRRGLAGWVRNRRDGSVEAVFSGAEDVVAGMLEALRHGPPASRVDAIDQREGSAGDMALSRPGERFSVLPTA